MNGRSPLAHACHLAGLTQTVGHLTGEILFNGRKPTAAMLRRDGAGLQAQGCAGRVVRGSVASAQPPWPAHLPQACALLDRLTADAV